MSKVKLTIKQEKFVHKYLECGNASEAYRFAYNANRMSDEVIRVKACELLKNGNVSVMINELQTELEKVSEITKGRVIRELHNILDAKITDYVDLITESVENERSEQDILLDLPRTYSSIQRLVFKDFSELTESQVRAIESVKHGRNGVEIKLHGKSWTIERICKMLGYDAPQVIQDVRSNQFTQMTDEELDDYISSRKGI